MDFIIKSYKIGEFILEFNGFDCVVKAWIIHGNPFMF